MTDHGHRRAQRAGKASLGMIIVAAMAVIAIAAMIAVVRVAGSHSGQQASRIDPVRYVGVYEKKSPKSYSQVNEFAKAIGREPNLVGYYSGWNEPFQSAFAETAAQHGAATIVQMDPTGMPLAKVVSGAYDSYLARFATAVAAFGHPVVISFGREMNGFWYTWGYHHTPPAVFVAAWRHIVTLFRQHGATNVKWLWQVNSSEHADRPGTRLVARRAVRQLGGGQRVLRRAHRYVQLHIQARRGRRPPVHARPRADRGDGRAPVQRAAARDP